MSEKPSRVTIANCSERAAKILRLALDPAAADGEQQAAACLFVAALRKCGATIETDAAPQLHHARTAAPASAWSPLTERMPFGKYKGARLADIPSDYLEWLISTAANLRPPLRRAIATELESRRDG